MQTIDTVLLSRIQFAFTITFHILFPAFSIGLACFLTMMEGFYLKTGHALYLRICKFWSKVFALTFGMGVVSGIVMEFQLGTNWSGFTQKVGGVLGALFTYEVMTAFFIEAGFLGIMLFGWEKVGKKLHFLATCLVTVGTTISAYWIMAANTWMHHPVGYRLTKAGMFEVTNWTKIVFNQDVLIRFTHMLFASYLSAGFVISGICAYYMLNKRHEYIARRCFRFVWTSFVVLVPLQLIMGDMNGEVVYRHQPIKTAAMEGIWDTQKGAPFLPFAIIDQKNQTNSFAIKIPYAASLINTHQLMGEMKGLKSVPPEDQPNVAMVFYTFRIMVGIGLLMLAMMAASVFLRYKKTFYSNKLFHKLCVLCAPIGFIAMETGWMTTEIGRQPWTVYGLLRTSQSASNVPPIDVWLSFGLIILVYGIIFGVFYFKFLKEIIQKGPLPLGVDEDATQPFHYINAVIGDKKS